MGAQPGIVNSICRGRIVRRVLWTNRAIFRFSPRIIRHTSIGAKRRRCLPNPATILMRLARLCALINSILPGACSCVEKPPVQSLFPELQSCAASPSKGSACLNAKLTILFHSVHKPAHADIHHNAQGEESEEHRGPAVTQQWQRNPGYRHKTDDHPHIDQYLKGHHGHNAHYDQ